MLEYIKQQQEKQDLQLLERNNFNPQLERSYIEGMGERRFIKEMGEDSYLDNMQGRNTLKQFLGKERADFSTPVQKFISGNFPPYAVILFLYIFFESMLYTGRRRNGVLVEELPAINGRDWEDNGGELDVVFVDNLDNPEVFFSADEYFNKWMKARDSLTVILPDEKAEYQGESSLLEIPFQSQIDEFEQKLELFPRSQARRNPYSVNPEQEKTRGRVYTLNPEDFSSHQEAGSDFYDRHDNTVSFRRNDVKPEFLSPKIVNGIKYLQLIEGKPIVHDTSYGDSFGDVTTLKNDKRRYERNSYDPRRISKGKKEERTKGVTFFKDDFFKNLERDWRQGQRWQPDLEKEMLKPRRKEKDRRWQELLFLTDPKTDNKDQRSGYQVGLFGEKLNLYTELKPTKQPFTPKLQSTGQERKADNSILSGTTPKPEIKIVASMKKSRPSTPLPFLSGSQGFDEEKEKHFLPEATRRQDDGSGWVPLINTGSSWDPVPITTTPPLDSPFQMVVKYPRDAPTRPSYQKATSHHRREGSGRFKQVE